MSLLDIITITKNDFRGICNTIESTKFLREHSGVKQIIIDSSTDETKNRVASLAESSNNVEYIWQEAVGISKAFNLGLGHSSSKWVWFLNGGDRIHPGCNLDHIIYLLDNSRADAVIFENEVSGHKSIQKHPPMWAMWPPLYAWIPHPSAFTRRQLYDQHGIFDESFEIAMDYEFWIRCLSKQVTVDTISIPLTLFDNSGISSTQPEKTAYEALRTIKKHFWPLLMIWLKSGISILRAGYTYMMMYFGLLSKKNK